METKSYTDVNWNIIDRFILIFYNKDIENFYKVCHEGDLERRPCGRMDMMKKRRSICGRFGRGAAFIVLCFTVICIISSCGDMPESSNSESALEPGISDGVEFDASASLAPGPWAAPPQFYYHGKMYYYEGRFVHSLPAGFELAGELNNIVGFGHIVRSNTDFDGNVDGTIYINPEESEVAYFRWAEWDEAASGPEPYLIFVLEEAGQP